MSRRPHRLAAVTRRPAPTWSGHGDLVASLVAIAPLWFAYELLLLGSAQASRVDVIGRGLLALSDGALVGYLLLHATLALGFLVWLRASARRATLRLDVMGPLCAEAAIYAMTMGALLALLIAPLVPLALWQGAPVAAIGAGIHEELVFRLGGFCGGAWLMTRAGVPARVAWAIALGVSSLVFAAAHHVGADGEAWRAGPFVFRAAAGALFAAIAWFRSLAHAVWAHAFYDLYLLLVRG